MSNKPRLYKSGQKPAGGGSKPSSSSGAKRQTNRVHGTQRTSNKSGHRQSKGGKGGLFGY